jgi:hypothetical protein
MRVAKRDNSLCIMSLSFERSCFDFCPQSGQTSELKTFGYELYARAHARAPQPTSKAVHATRRPAVRRAAPTPDRRIGRAQPQVDELGPAAQVHPPTPTRRGSSTLGPAAQAHPPGHPAVHMHMQSLDAYTRPRPQPRPRPRSQPRTRHRDRDRDKDRALRRRRHPTKLAVLSLSDLAILRDARLRGDRSGLEVERS